ncbi:aldehyde dehydrogenase (NADP(+)) [Silvibacterium sp.]|uniref:aldehyde dehydrogenase (NADP(+)) n=1 Tax=Silvibacterium sp. TaxID=1964179 RepID=UPI0039E44E75
MALLGVSFLGADRAAASSAPFHGINPATGETLPGDFYPASAADLNRAVTLAHEAAISYRRLSGKDRAAFLRAIADRIQAIAEQLVERANLETALPLPRLQGEVGRTTGQLRLFADVVEEGSWTSPRIDTALPDRKPLPRPDLRTVLVPIGPVAVFGASNFPLAFSVAGGDTASALAAGNPVVVKAHPAHPGTSELVATAIQQAVKDCGLHPGVFSMVFDAGIEIGVELVQHPFIKAVGFTGSLAAGKALVDLCNARPEPIPCYAEMSSTNPVFILPGALKQHEKIAGDLTASYTLGAGQFCTKPGLVFLDRSADAASLVEGLKTKAAGVAPFSMLTPGIAKHYRSGLENRAADAAVTTLYRSETESTGAASTAALLETTAAELLSKPELADEIFGPSTLLIHYDQREQMLAAARGLRGHLTATILGTEEDLTANADLIAILEQKVGRLIFNAYPTGVEVSHAMVHGGPYPATSDSRTTSVGSMAIFRFARPVCFQGYPQSLLPAELQDANPLGVQRLVNGVFTRDAIQA